uniref:Uncharacterized protein n=1 Tax=Anguilla anguilla TaxID=7936 RepID=A0A0E9P597_ANGAN
MSQRRDYTHRWLSANPEPSISEHFVPKQNYPRYFDWSTYCRWVLW